MADKKPAEGETEPPKKRGKLLIIIAAVVAVVLIAGGAGAYLLLKKSHNVDEEGDEPVAEGKSAKKSKVDPDLPPVFVKLEAFTVKLQPEQTDAYLQTVPELRVLEAPVADKVKQYMPEIRHRVLLILSGKKPSEIGTPQGVQKLSNEIRDDVNLIIGGPKRKRPATTEASDRAGPDDPIQAVLFTSFIIQ